MKITFLVDKTNNWIEPYILKYINAKKVGNISYDHLSITDCDIVFILGYTKILENSFLETNKLNLIVHESELPKGKGFSPIQWQILEGKNEIVFTLFEAQSDIDSGNIYLQKKVTFSGFELFDEIRDIQGKKTLELIDEFLTMYPIIQPKKQTGCETMYPRRKDKDDMLNIDNTLREQFNHLRIANNEEYPLWFEINGHKYILKIYKDEK